MNTNSINYGNEASADPTTAPDLESGDNAQTSNSVPVYVTHQLNLAQVSFYMEEFRIGECGERETISRDKNATPAAEQYYSTMSDLPTDDQAKEQHNPNEEDNDDLDTTASSIYYTAEEDCNEGDNDYDGDFDQGSDPMYCTKALQIANIQSVDTKLIVKTSDNVQGPKRQLELQTGAVTVLLTPRQLHGLCFLLNMMVPDHRPNTDATNDKADPPNGGKCDSNADSKAYNAMSGNVGLNQCWSSDPINDCQSTMPAMDTNTIKETSSMSNSITSLASGYTQTTIRNRRHGVIELDPHADILRANIRIACIAITLLQEVWLRSWCRLPPPLLVLSSLSKWCQRIIAY